MGSRLLRFFIITCLLFLGIRNANAATYDWIGNKSANWNAVANWQQGIIPTATDIVHIGVQYAIVQLPNINGVNDTVKSVMFGSNYATTINTGINFKNSGTLTVTGDITVQADVNTLAQVNNIVYFTGTGTITATNLNILSNYSATSSYTQTVVANLTNINLTGNIALTSNDNGTSTVTYNSVFDETSGIVNVTGKLATTNTTNATSAFMVNPAAIAGATLQLANATALSSLSATGINTVSFNNTYATIEYSGAAQTIYSDLAITGLTTGPVYYSIKLSGTGVKTLNAGNYLTIYGDFTNTLTNDASNYAVLTTCTVRFIGSNSQNLYGGAGNGTTFKKLNTNLGNSKYMQSGTFYLESDGTLLMNGSNAGTILYTNGLLTLLSDAGSTAAVGNNNIEPTIIGNLNVQRFVTGGTGYRGYRLFSSPVNINNVTSQSSTVAYIGLSYLNSGTTGVLTAGPGGTGSGFSVTNANPLIYLYDQSRTTNNTSYTSGKDIGITSITGATGAPAYSVTTLGAATTTGVRIPVGTSYLVYYVGSTASTILSSTRVPDNATAAAVGYANQGTIPVTFWNYTNTGTTAMPYTTGTGSFLSGVNQMGNPYPSTISLTQVYADNKPLISPTFYELDEPGQSYMSFNSSDSTRSDARASRYIVSGQGFLSVAMGTGSTFTFYEDQKVGYPNMTTTTTTKAQGGTLLMDVRAPQTALADADAAITQLTTATKVAVPVLHDAFIEQSNNTLSGLHLQITRDSLTYKQTGIYFGKTRSDTYNRLEDAYDLGGPAPQVYISSFSSDGIQLSINEMGDYVKGKRIKLYVKSVSDGSHIISLADVQHIDTNMYHILLVDNLQKDSVDLAKKGAYAFNITTADTTTYGANRFVLAIRPKKRALYKLLDFLGQKVITGVQLNWKVMNAGNYTGFTLQKLNGSNNYASLYSIQSDSSSTYTYVDKHPVIGNNVYRLAQNDITGNITYSAQVTIGYNITSPNGMLTVYPNPSKSIINISLGSGSINSPAYTSDIYNTSGILIKHETTTGATWTDDISPYKSGVYIIMIKDNNGKLIGQAKFSKID